MKQLPLSLSARALRDEALLTVAGNAGYWMDEALFQLRIFMRDHKEFIGEEFRCWATERGLPAPHHHNAWGAVMRTAFKRGMVEATDRMRSMETARSHARRSPVWVRK